MTPELPALRLGLAGFTARQIDEAQYLLAERPAGQPGWQLAPFTEADALCINGGRALVVSEGVLRIGPGTPQSRSVHLNLSEVDRPLGVAQPLPAAAIEPGIAFRFDDPAEVHALLDRFAAWLQPLVAQFCLADSLLQHHAALGTGVFEVLHEGRLLAIVDLRGAVGVLPTAQPGDFVDAMWRRCAGEPEVPESFARLSLSELMWQFANRSGRDLLPPHYRSGLLYFRRSPRLAHRLLRDSHLLLLRELSAGCATMAELHVRTGMALPLLARDLAALYLVGAITSNPGRAAARATRRLEVNDSVLLSAPPSLPPDALERAVTARGATAPAPLRPR
ncbi:MAG: hypothetical protein HY854_23800 [Burkholderiales bacterium]|nr:hypothetical protein [Burkholderiales bacterium]